MENTGHLEELLRQIIEQQDCRLYELNWLNGSDHTLQVAITKNDGTMDLDTCALVSEKLSEYLDNSDLIKIAYTLEVCSPGAEREVKDLNELRNTTTTPYIFVRLIHPVKKQKELTGSLVEYKEDGTMRLEYRDKAAKRIAEFNDTNIEFIRYAVKF